MAKRKRTSNFKEFESTTKNARHLRITENMLESNAWKELDVFEQALYMHIKRKFWVNSNGESNSNNIVFTYREGLELMSKAKFTKSLDKLIDVGLIDLVAQWRHSKKPNIYGLSARWHKYGTDSFEQKSRKKAKCPYRGGSKPKK